MDEPHIRHGKLLGERAVAALAKNGFAAAFLENGGAARDYILERVPAGASVGFGGSHTVKALGVADALAARGCEVLDHNAPGLSKDEQTAIRYRQLTADCFISGSNAVTLAGELVNRDGIGNRVAAMIFGPKTVFVVAGVNKIVRDLAEAEARIRLTAAPLNCLRLGLPTPCVERGECADCRSERRICNITSIIGRRPPLAEFHVLIVGEALGF